MKLGVILAIALALLSTSVFAQTNQGSSPLTGAKGGTNNKFMQFTGPATSMKTFTLPNVSDTIALLTQSQTLTNKTINCSSNTCSNLPVGGIAAIGAYTFIGNNTGSSATPTAVDIAALTTKASPAAGDYIMLSDQAASGAWKKAAVSSIASAGSVSSFNGQTGSISLSVTPQVRITLVSGLAVPTTDQVGISTVWVTPVGGGYVPIYDGTNWQQIRFAEVSQTAADTTKSPAAVGNNLIYDIVCWVDSGTNRCTRMAARASDSTAGLFTFVNGVPLNTSSVTNGPAASRGTYVGSVRSNGTATFDLKFGTSAAGGGEAWIGVWNMYNRVMAATRVQDSTASWTVGTTLRSLNNSATNRISILHGIDEDAVTAQVTIRSSSTASNNVQFGFCLDSTTAFSGNSSQSFATGAIDINHVGNFNGFIGTGFHFIQACEFATAGTNTGRQNAAGATTAVVWW